MCCLLYNRRQTHVTVIPATFFLAVCLRMQVDPSNKEFKGISPVRAFADWALANLVLQIVVWNYMG